MYISDNNFTDEENSFILYESPKEKGYLDNHMQVLNFNFCPTEVEDNIKKQKNLIDQETLYDQNTKPTANYNMNILEENLQNDEHKTSEFVTIGKKRGRGAKSGDHTKFSDDNLRRKVKHIVLNDIKKFINDTIYDIYKGNIGNGIFRKELLTINQKQKSDASVEFNKKFLDKKLGDIFSENISTRFTIYPLNHNKKIIEALKNEDDEKKKTYFNKLFNISFFECLNHFRGNIEIEELKGLPGLVNVEENYKNEPDYLETLKYYIMNYETITNNKKKRNRRKKNEIKN
jgi:hypothetical protein